MVPGRLLQVRHRPVDVVAIPQQAAQKDKLLFAQMAQDRFCPDATLTTSMASDGPLYAS